jgi:hypothetical protein
MQDKEYNSLVEELQKQIKAHREELEELVNNWSNLQFDVHPRLMDQYRNLFGSLEHTLKTKNVASDTIKYKIELLKKLVDKGEKVTEEMLTDIDVLARQHASKVRSRKVSKEEVDQFFKKIDESESRSMLPFSAIDKKYELTKIYRDLVKKLHPDATNRTDLFNRYWGPVQTAYESENLERLSLYHKILCPMNNKDFKVQQTKLNALRMELSDLQTSVLNEKKKIKKILDNEPFNLEDKFNSKIWVSSRKKQLENEIFFTDLSIRKGERQLNAISRYQYKKHA